ncbi:hypothetical protein C8R43DRAFT_965907 [Mycena crocata]|nr:hypothetical protein C8R43DRAFT_965907 [Mycena crocata]
MIPHRNPRPARHERHHPSPPATTATRPIEHCNPPPPPPGPPQNTAIPHPKSRPDGPARLPPPPATKGTYPLDSMYPYDSTDPVDSMYLYQDTHPVHSMYLYEHCNPPASPPDPPQNTVVPHRKPRPAHHPPPAAIAVYPIDSPYLRKNHDPFVSLPAPPHWQNTVIPHPKPRREPVAQGGAVHHYYGKPSPPGPDPPLASEGRYVGGAGGRNNLSGGVRGSTNKTPDLSAGIGGASGEVGSGSTQSNRENKKLKAVMKWVAGERGK